MGGASGTGTVVRVEGRTLSLTNLDKVLYPAVGFTKAEVIDYYRAIAPALLPHLAGRPLTLKRYPDGVDAPYFYEKNCPGHRPPWMKTAPLSRSARGGERRNAVWSPGKERDITFCLVEDLPGLIWTANLASLELHTMLSRTPDLERATVVAFDLDPGPPAGIPECAAVALRIRDLLGGLGLAAWPKTSGSKGLQLYVPLNGDGATYAETKAFARAMAETLERAEPDRVVSKMAKELRGGKVFIDWSQNDLRKTTVCVWSLRARERPTVSTPLAWEEVEAAAAERRPLAFVAAEAVARFERDGDRFRPVVEIEQRLPGGVPGGADGPVSGPTPEAAGKAAAARMRRPAARGDKRSR